MIKNYAKIAFRNLLKYRGYTAINLVGLSLVLITFTLIWHFGNNWLSDFAYHVDINPVIFLITMCITLFMAIATVIVQTIKAGSMNPVDVLKAE